MQILVQLDSVMFNRFRASVSTKWNVRLATFVGLETRLAESDAVAIVIDPTQLRRDEFVALIKTASARRNAAVVVYTTLSPATARAVLEASQVMAVEVVFVGTQDERNALEAACERFLDSSVPSLVLHGLAPEVLRMPRALATRIVELFCGERVPRSTSAMLSGLGVSIDTARAWLAAARICRPHMLRLAAVLARTFPDLALNRNCLEQIIERTGTTSARSFRRACVKLIGLSARQAGRLSEAEVAGRMLSAICRPRALRGARLQRSRSAAG
jgi:hypothetical protein